MILAADIGGTKSLFGLFHRDNPERCIAHRRLTNADFCGFPEVLAAALDELTGANPADIDAVCLALAGPIADDSASARLTNLPWQIDAQVLATRFKLPPITLVNDFAAAAMGAVLADEAQRYRLQTGTPLASAPQLVVGAGTGLGMAVVLPSVLPSKSADDSGNSDWRIIPSEGGHLAFAPADEEQAQLWQALHTQHGRVTWERVLSGPGLAAIYRFIAEREGEPATLTVEQLCSTTADPVADPMGNPVVTPVTECVRDLAVDLFLRCYGAYAGDMAMSVLARGGVHLAGGIAARLLPAFQRGGFTTAFNDKAEHTALVMKMPVSVCTDPLLGLIGAAHLATHE